MVIDTDMDMDIFLFSMLYFSNLLWLVVVCRCVV